MKLDLAWLSGALVVMTIGAEVLVRGSAALALRFRLSPLFIGLTVVAFGTSSPELAASLTASARGSGDIAVGNVVGSNIFNVALILGVAALIHPIQIHFESIRRDVLVATAVATVPFLALLFGGVIPRWLGASMVAVLGIYTYASLQIGRRDGARLAEAVDPGEILAVAPTGEPVRRIWVDATQVLVGLALLVLGSRIFVTAAIGLAREFEVSELLIGLTIVAAGTSMPELLTSTVAAIRGQSDIAVGNVLGSNIFNILGVLGACAAVQPQAVASQVLWLDAPVMLVASIALLPIARSSGCISRKEGGALVAGFAAYLGLLVVLSR